MVRTQSMIAGARTWLVAAALIAMIGGLAAGCGPVGYIHQVTIKADSSVAAARVVGAERYAPYWYTLAVLYLHRARQEAAMADYQAANRFGKKAHAAAVKARELAIQRAANPDDEDWLPPPSLRYYGAGRSGPAAAEDAR
jgi:hypothetical protein